MNKTENKSNTIKLLAIMFMLIDHIGAVFFPNQKIFRIIGRLSFPLFAYQLTIGFKHTLDLEQYMLRLWLFSIVSQIPYVLLFKTTNLNILFTLFLALFVLKEIEEENYYWILFGTLLAELLSMDYGAYGVLIVIYFYYFYDYKFKNILIFIAINIIYTIFNPSSPQFFSIFSLPLIYLIDYLPEIRINKKTFYLFYPAHLTILLIIKYVLEV